MSETVKNEPMTRYLAFKVAIMSGDNEWAAECLQHVSAASVNDPKLLYACCLAAQQANSKQGTVQALKLLIERSEFQGSGSVHLPALLRCTVRLLIHIINDDGETLSATESAVEDICAVFESGKALPIDLRQHELIVF